MRIRTSLAVGAAVLSSGLACAIEDNSAAVFVEVTSVAPVVVRGAKVQLTARARRMENPTDTADIRNIQYAWATSDPAIATIVGDAFGGAELTGVNAGTVDVTATAVSFESSEVGTFQMRVSNVLEVDSVRPTSVKWGEKLRLYGVGVRNVFLAELGTPLFQDTLTFQGDPQGLGVMEFWVPPPARTDSLLVLGPGVFFTVDEVTAVDTLDLYEPNDTIPALISLDGQPPYPQLPSLLFFNPALAFEDPSRVGTTTQGTDWYRFTRADVSRPITFVIKPQSVADSTAVFTFLGDSIVYAGGHAVVNPTWYVSTQGQHWCDKGVIDAPHKRPDSLIVALKRRPQYTPTRSTIDVLSFYSVPQRHAIGVADGYLVTDSRIQPDRFEENDICIFADTNFFAPPTQIDLNPAPTSLFGDSTLTIDNPHEVDWYRFRVTQGLPTDLTMIRVRSRPFTGGPFFDRSDIDLYIVRSDSPTSFETIAVVAPPGSADSTRLLLPTGDYYLIVADFAGEATRYSMCIRVRNPCTPPIPLAEAAVTEAAVRAAANGKDRKRKEAAELRTRSVPSRGQPSLLRP